MIPTRNSASLVREKKPGAKVASVSIESIPKPWVEKEHCYNAEHTGLLYLGLEPHYLSDFPLDSLLNIALEYRERIDKSIVLPSVSWREGKKKVEEKV